MGNMSSAQEFVRCPINRNVEIDALVRVRELDEPGGSVHTVGTSATDAVRDALRFSAAQSEVRMA